MSNETYSGYSSAVSFIRAQDFATKGTFLALWLG